jgi:RecA/RadA recombinase
MSILEKIKKNTTIKDSAILAQSKFFTRKDMVPTSIPIINVALSGRMDGGLTPGLTMWAGPSKHFKTAFSLLMARSYLDKYPDAALLFYDSEFGTPQSYFDSFGIDTNRVLHTPITDLEQLKFDIMQQMDNIDRGDRVMIVIDSIGNLASKKEVQDALDGKSVADMSRAKQIKSLFRMVTPQLTMKNLPCIVINHIYMEQGMFPKAIVSGGTGVMLSANQVFIIGRSQEKEGTDVVGWNFTINIEKSRFVKEKSKLTFNVTYSGGIDKYSGLFDLALEAGYLIKSGARYQLVNPETGEINEKKMWAKDIGADIYESLLVNDKFKEFVKNKYALGSSVAMAAEINELDDEDEAA